jgi:hypothetical protein
MLKKEIVEAKLVKLIGFLKELNEIQPRHYEKYNWTHFLRS